MPTPTSLIRNFSIIAHIDHGKSTLADRLLDATGALSERERKAQFLDSMDLERERGITIKAATVRLSYEAEDGADLRAQPHRHARARRLPLRGVAFAGRLRGRRAGRRRLAGGRGADAGQRLPGRRTTTSTIIPVINKIDLPAADPENVRRQIEEVIGIDASDAILASAKDGQGDPRDPRGGRRQGPAAHRRRRRAAARCCCSTAGTTPTAAWSSWCASSTASCGRSRRSASWPRAATTRSRPSARSPRSRARSPSWPPARSGSSPPRSRRSPTRASATPSPRPAAPAPAPLPGFQPAKPMVFAGIFPTDSARYDGPARRAGQAAPQRRLVHRASPRRRRRWGSASAAASWACCTWRSSRSGSSANTTWTSSPPRRPCASAACCKNGEVIELDNPAKFPSEGDIDRIEEPIIAATIHTPPEYVGRHPQAVRGAARHPDRPDLRRREAGDHPLRPAADRGGVRLLRPDEVGVARLRLARLRAQGLPGGRPGAPGPAGQRRSGRLAVAHRPPRDRPSTRAATCASR